LPEAVAIGISSAMDATHLPPVAGKPLAEKIAAAAAHRGAELQKVFARSATKPIASSDWSDSVVRALATRLPYGAHAITSECSACKSEFCPCLCGADGKGLRPPRVVLERERLRIHALENPGESVKMGSLDQVKAHAFTHGVDKGRLFLSGSMRPFKATDGGPVKNKEQACDIVLRDGLEYLVQPEEAGANGLWTQTLKMTQQELKELCNNVDDQACVAQTLKPLKLKSVNYESWEEAEGDVELMRLPGPGASKGPFRIIKVKPEGNAAKAGVCIGQNLWSAENPCQRPECLQLNASAAEQSGKKGCPHRKHIPLDDHSLGLPGPFRAGIQPGSNHKELAWPITFHFDALPEGWRAHLEDDGGKKELTELAEQGPAEVTFQHPKEELVSRSKVDRHEHHWERAVADSQSGKKGDTNGHYSKQESEMLRDWGIKIRGGQLDSDLTPAQLDYTFKKLIEIISKDLAAFELIRKECECRLIDKSCRAAHLLESIMDRKAGGKEPEAGQAPRKLINVYLEEIAINKEEAKDHRHLTAQEKARIESLEFDMDEICRRTPTYFLIELRDSCRQEEVVHRKLGMSASNEMTMKKAPSSPARGAQRQLMQKAEMGHHGEGGGKVVSSVADEVLTRLVEILIPTVTKRTRNSREVLTDASVTMALHEAEKQFCEAVLDFMAERISRFVTSNEEQLSSTNNRDVVNSKTDGRMSFSEFQFAMYSAGVSWMTRQDMRRRFDTLDNDKSGFLSLGEVLKGAYYMRNIVRELEEVTKEQQKRDAHKKSGPF